MIKVVILSIKRSLKKSGHMDYYNQDVSHIGSLLKVNVNSKDSVGYAEKAKNQKEKVAVVSIDDFLIEHKIEKIDF